MPTRTFTPIAPVNLGSAIGGYSAGGHDPSIALEADGAWLALRTPDGPATLHFTGGDPITAEAWGPGAEAALERGSRRSVGRSTTPATLPRSTRWYAGC